MMTARALSLAPLLLLLPHAAAHGEDLRDPDEDVDGVGVDGDGVVDRVVEGHAVRRVRVLLGAVQDLPEVMSNEIIKYNYLINT